MNTVCDVGASVGTVSIPLLKAFPHLKIVDQDLPEVVARAKDVSTLFYVFVSPPVPSLYQTAVLDADTEG